MNGRTAKILRRAAALEGHSTPRRWGRLWRLKTKRKRARLRQRLVKLFGAMRELAAQDLAAGVKPKNGASERFRVAWFDRWRREAV